MKRFIKQLVGLFLLPFIRTLIKLGRRKVLILSYHRILPRSHPEYNRMQPGMVVSNDTFRKHIRWLSDYLNFIRLCEIDKFSNIDNKPTCIITMDDGWLDNFQYAFPILKEFNVPATIFLVSNMIDTENYFWPEKLGLLLDDKNAKKLLMQSIEDNYSLESVENNGYDDLIKLLKSKSDSSIIKILEEVENKAKKLDGKFQTRRQILNFNELAEMEKSGLVDYGSHTANHIRLDKVSLVEAIHELKDSKKHLESVFKKDIRIFCYPNGSYTHEVINEVSKVYELACTTEKGWVGVDSNPHKLKRVLLHDDVSNTKSLFWGRVLGVF